MWRKATCYKSASVAALAITSAIATTGIAAAADITYDVNQMIVGPAAAGTVTGTITTDGTLGGLFTGAIVDFNLTMSVGGDTSTLVRGVNGFAAIGSSGITATPTELTFDFSRTGTFANFFASPGCAPVWTLRTAGGTACNGVSGTVNSVQAVPTASGGAIATMAGSGNETIATVEAPPPEIPLPPAIYLFGSVLGGAFWMSRRKRSAVSSLGSA
jgi:hypothetical protein